MDSKLSLDNYLLILKSTVEVYVHATQESSNDDIRNLFNESLNDILDSQANTYNTMVSYGFYQVNNVDNSKLEQTLNKLSSQSE